MRLVVDPAADGEQVGEAAPADDLVAWQPSQPSSVALILAIVPSGVWRGSRTGRCRRGPRLSCQQAGARPAPASVSSATTTVRAKARRDAPPRPAPAR